MAGVQTNSVGDLPVFLTGLVTNSMMIVTFFIVFSVLRRRIPLVYAGKVHTSTVPFEPSDTFFGWVTASFALRLDDVIEYAGLDQAMMLEFTHLAMSTLSFLAVPLLLVMGPVHWLFGGDRSGDDHLSKLGFANIVDDHPWLYWVHSVFVWFVVVVVQRFIYQAQARFIELRKAWLKAMPTPRCTTVLVQNIPVEHCTDVKVAAYFDNVFQRKVVETANVVKHTETLLGLIAEKEKTDKIIEEATAKEQKTGERPTFYDYTGSKVDAINYYTDQSQSSVAGIQEEKKRITDAMKNGDQSVFTQTAFVTFKTRRDAEIALNIAYTEDEEDFVCEIPPDASDVIYADFQKDPLAQNIKVILGYSMVAGVFWSYMPAVIGIAYITDLQNLSSHIEFFQSMAADPATVVMWNAMMGSLALQLFVSFVPTFFVLIFSFFFLLKAKAWLQHRIQNWYFWFQVVYILLVTAVGSSIIATINSLVESPTLIFNLLATTMPYATHFYLNFIPLQWVSHAQNMLRMVQLFKFFSARAIYDEAIAKEKAEPEDQDYYGIGSRSARHSFIFALVLVYCQLTPLIIPLGFVNFLVCRLVYGYLIVFAEIRKPDLGGVFWVTNLMNVQRCMLIYIALMAGVLCFRDDTYWPCIIAGSSYWYWQFSFSRFQGAFRWESLCLEDMLDISPHHARKQRVPSDPYVQKELLD